MILFLEPRKVPVAGHYIGEKDIRQDIITQYYGQTIPLQWVRGVNQTL